MPAAHGDHNNDIWATRFQDSQRHLNIGQYAYNSTAQQFKGTFPALDLGQLEHGPGRREHQSAEQPWFRQDFQFHAAEFPRPRHRRVPPAGHLRDPRLLRVDALLQLCWGRPITATARATTRTRWCRRSASIPPSSSAGMPAGTASAPYGNANISITSADGRPPVIPTSIPIAAGTSAFSAAPSSLRHDAGRRRSLQEQLGDQRVLCPDRRPGAEHRQPGELDL